MHVWDDDTACADVTGNNSAFEAEVPVMHEWTSGRFVRLKLVRSQSAALLASAICPTTSIHLQSPCKLFKFVSHTQAHAHTYKHAHTFLCTNVHTFARTHTRARIKINITTVYTLIHTLTHRGIHKHACTHTHTHSYTLTPSASQSLRTPPSEILLKPLSELRPRLSVFFCLHIVLFTKTLFFPLHREEYNAPLTMHLAFQTSLRCANR